MTGEFENALHPHMLEPIPGLFANPATNPHRSQLLFTCHAVEVLRLRDKPQVLLVEKDACNGSSAWRLGGVEGIRRNSCASRSAWRLCFCSVGCGAPPKPNAGRWRMATWWCSDMGPCGVRRAWRSTAQGRRAAAAGRTTSEPVVALHTLNCFFCYCIYSYAGNRHNGHRYF